MITAKNYAAQAIKSLRFSSDFLLKKQDQDSQVLGELAKRIIPLIENSVHFALPDGGNILNNGGKSIVGQTVRLPYEYVTIEYFVPVSAPAHGLNTEHAPKRLVIVAEMGYESVKHLKPQVKSEYYFMVWGVATRDYSPNWYFIPDKGFSLIPCTGWDNKDVPGAIVQTNEEYDMTHVPIYAGIHPLSTKSCKSEEDFQSLLLDVAADNTGNNRAVFELIEALSCRNVSTVNHQDASTSNAKRVKAGKLPFYETKMLVINSQGVSSGEAGNGGGSHASPRQHLRRGHIRRLESGSIWVNSCVVGDATKGQITKVYEVV